MNQLLKKLDDASPEELIRLSSKLNHPSVDRLLCVCYIKLEQYDKALEYAQEDFEKAYCFYRLNRLEEALSLLQSSERELLLKAQVLYRLERYQQALEIYRSLEQSEDIQTNQTACQLLLEQDFRPKTYEQLYHFGLLLVSKGNLEQARQVCQESIQLCQQTLREDDFDQSDIQSEQAPMVLLLGCLDLLEGNLDKAKEQFELVLHQPNVDPSLLSICHLNLLTTSSPFDAQKHLHKTNDEKFNTKQKQLLQINRMVLKVKMSKKTVKKEEIQQLITELGPHDSLLLCLLTVDPSLFESLKRDHPQSLGLHLYQIQHLLKSNKFDQALEILESLLGVYPQQRPGLVSILLFVYQKTNQYHKGLDLLNAEQSLSILSQVAEFKLKLGRHKEAQQDYKRLVENNPNDLKSLARLVIANNHLKADTTHLDKLGSISFTLDPQSLLVLPKSEQPVEKTLKRRKKQKPLPKDYQPDRQPNPERWLPKVMRSDYKQRKDLSKGTQGLMQGPGALGSTGSANIAGMKKRK
ncbi:hypothetical protein EDD86DRAFT_214464, partial [Gorgonomyces haynaldii]